MMTTNEGRDMSGDNHNQADPPRKWLTCRESPNACAETFHGATLAEASRAFYAHVADEHRGEVSS